MENREDGKIIVTGAGSFDGDGKLKEAFINSPALRDSYRTVYIMDGLDAFVNILRDKDAKLIKCDSSIGNPGKDMLRDQYDPEKDLLLEKGDIRLNKILNLISN